MGISGEGGYKPEAGCTGEAGSWNQLERFACAVKLSEAGFTELKDLHDED